MGTPAEPIPVSEETQALVQQSEPATLADVAGEAHPEEVQAEWYVVRQQGTKNFLAEVRNTNSQPLARALTFTKAARRPMKWWPAARALRLYPLKSALR
jgi:hypothetical protein